MSHLDMLSSLCRAVAKPTLGILASHMKAHMASSVSLGFNALHTSRVIENGRDV